MKKNSISISILMDDRRKRKDMDIEHGFSALINFNDNLILFDTGQSDKYIHNANKLGIDLKKVKCVIISHGHYDHIGGLKSFLKINDLAKVYLKKEALNRKLKFKDGKYVDIGTTDNYSQYMNRFVFSDDTEGIMDNVFVSSVTENFGFKIHNMNMYVKNNEDIVQDYFKDEQFMYIYDEDKIHIITGCSHRGIVNIARSAVLQSNTHKIGFIIGGFHMLNEDDEHIEKEVKALGALGIQWIGPCHCTGKKAANIFRNRFSEHFVDVGTGSVIDL